MKVSDRLKLAAATTLATLAWTFILLAVSVPVALVLLLIVTALTVRWYCRMSRAHGVG